MTMLARLRRFVDWDLGKTGGVRAGAWTLLIGGAPFVLLLIVEGLVGYRSLMALAVAIAVTAAWLLFVGWRGWRLLRAFGARTDRQFDRDSKYRFPPEYGDSESVTKTRQRRRR